MEIFLNWGCNWGGNIFELGCNWGGNIFELGLQLGWKEERNFFELGLQLGWKEERNLVLSPIFYGIFFQLLDKI